MNERLVVIMMAIEKDEHDVGIAMMMLKKYPSKEETSC